MIIYFVCPVTGDDSFDEADEGYEAEEFYCKV
jgi:hypothetical protein